MVHAAGSLLFALALIAALAVIASQFFAYRKPMVAALRTLRLDTVHQPGPQPKGGRPVLSYRPADPARALMA